MKIFRQLNLALLTALLALLSLSCSKNEESALLDSVPASATTVATIDLDQLLKQAGCQVKGNAYVLSHDLKRLLKDNDKKAIDVINRFRSFVDLHNIVLFDTPRGTAMTFNMTDISAIADMVNADEYFEKLPDSNRFKVFRIKEGNGYMLISGGQGWICDDPEELIGIIKEAEKKSINSIDAVAEFLASKPSPVKVYASLNYMVDAAALVDIKIDDRSMNCEASLIDAKGETIEFNEFLAPVGTDFLTHVPGNAQLVVAIALNPDYDWSSITSMLAMINPAFDNLGQSAGQLKNLDGPIVLAANPAGGSQALSTLEPGAWDLTMLAKLKPDFLTEALDGLFSLINSSGAQDLGDDDGVTHFRGDFAPMVKNIWLGDNDGYLFASTRKPVDSGLSSAASIFDGALAAAMVEIPYQSETMKAFNLPYGFRGEIKVGKDKIIGKARFNGSHSSFLETLVEIAAKNYN